MKLVVDVPEGNYKALKKMSGCGLGVYHEMILNGTPLEEELEKIKAEVIKSCNNIAQEVSDLSYTRKIYVYEQLSEIKGAIDNRISELKGEQE